MTEEKESSFKVTDRRKFNADGSPRDQGAEPEAARANELAEPQPVPTGHGAAEPQPVRVEPVDAPPSSTPNNVVSFPGGDASKNSEQKLGSTGSEPSPKASAARETSQPAASSATAATQGEAAQAFNSAAGPRPEGVPEASFVNLLNMLAVEAAIHLGMIHPQGQEPLPVDLESARHLIDMLGMLQAKTRGNLTAEEDALLENILADLRMQFVAVSKGQ